jgi:nucleoside-diphosphate-sugar epimerase
MTVSLVTGAGGFVGAHLCRLLEARGTQVRRISSRPGVASSPTPLLRAPDVDLAAAVEGAEQVYFVAGIAHEAVSADDRESMRQVNVEAPLRWLRAADRVGVRRFVWLSSIKVLGDSAPQPLCPDDAYRPGDAYARSKVEAEQRLLVEPLHTTTLAVVRPPLVYGPGVRGNFATLLRLAASGLPLPLRSADAPRSLVAVDNLCDLLVRLGSDGDGIFHVGDDADITVASLVKDVRRLLGLPPRLFRLPQSMVRRSARLLRQSGTYERLFEPLQVDSRATRSRLDWTPPRRMDDALEDTVTWFRTSR